MGEAQMNSIATAPEEKDAALVRMKGCGYQMKGCGPKGGIPKWAQNTGRTSGVQVLDFGMNFTISFKMITMIVAVIAAMVAIAAAVDFSARTLQRML